MPEAPALTLFYSRGLPGAVDMVNGNNAVLYISSGSQFIRASKDDPFPSAAQVGKHLIPLLICLRIVYKADFFLRYSL